MPRSRLVLLLLATLTLSACGDGIGGVGEACGAGCDEGLMCMQQMPGTLCTVACGGYRDPCKTGDHCTGFGGGSYCMPRCEGDGDCRTGYTCVAGAGLASPLRTCVPAGP